MAKLLLTLLLIAFCFAGYSQNTETKQKPKDTIPYEVRYARLKKLYIQMRQSKPHQVADSLGQVFFYKITPDMELADISKENWDYFAWAKENLSKTEFKDLAEAEKLWASCEEALKTSALENKEYYDYAFEARKFEGGAALQMTIMNEVRAEHPEFYKRIKLPKRKKKSDFYPKLPGQ